VDEMGATEKGSTYVDQQLRGNTSVGKGKGNKLIKSILSKGEGAKEGMTKEGTSFWVGVRSYNAPGPVCKIFGGVRKRFF